MIGIRSAILLAFLPIFVAFGLMSAMIEHFLVKQELLWGLKEESASIALGIAAFVDHNAFEKAKDKQIDKIPTLLIQRNIKSISIFDLSSGKEISRFESSQSSAGSSISESERSALIQSKSTTMDSFGSGSGTEITTLIPIHSEGREALKGLRVITDGSSMDQQLAELHSALKLRVILLALIGLPASWLFGTLLTRRIQSTRLRAQSIVNDPSPRAPKTTYIRELDDVNETIEILAALLEERQRYSPKATFNVDKNHISSAGPTEANFQQVDA